MPVISLANVEVDEIRPGYFVRWLSQGQGVSSLLTHQKLSVGSFATPHVHDIDDMLVVTKGRIDLLYEEEWLPELGAGTVVLVPPHTVHGIFVRTETAELLTFNPDLDPYGPAHLTRVISEVWDKHVEFPKSSTVNRYPVH